MAGNEEQTKETTGQTESENMEQQVGNVISEIMGKSAFVNPETDEDFSSIYKMRDVHAFLRLILLLYGTLTIYVIEPYIEQNEGEPIKIPAGDNYTIHDYGGRLVISANDIYASSLFACSAFLNACDQTLQILIDAGASEIAILGDQRAKLFVWDRCERLKSIENLPISVINFSPPEIFNITREAVLRYLKNKGLIPTTRPPKAVKNA